MTLRAVLFDLDCTLADRGRSIDHYVGAFLDRFGKQLDDAGRAADLRNAVRAVLGEADGGGYNADHRAADIVAGLPWIRKPRAADVDRHWKSTFAACTVPMEHAFDTLEVLREEGYALGIVTNGPVAAQEGKIAHLGLAERVDAVIVSEAVGSKKPDAGIFEAALEALDVSATDAAYVGDHPVNDVQGAADAGLTAIWLRGWQDWPADDPPADYTVDSLAEVPDLIAEL